MNRNDWLTGLVLTAIITLGFGAPTWAGDTVPIKRSMTGSVQVRNQTSYRPGSPVQAGRLSVSVTAARGYPPPITRAMQGLHGKARADP